MMKASQFVLMAMTILAASTVAAGGSSTVGPASPRFIFRCFDISQNIHVDLFRSSPQDTEETLAVTSLIPMNSVSEHTQLSIGGRMDGKAHYRSQRFHFAVDMNSTIRQDGRTFMKATVTDALSWEAQKEMELNCESIQN